MLLAPLLTSLCAPASALELSVQDTLVCGRYVEARTASVFAGACHYNGELVSDGREALLGWQFETGTFAGVDFGGRALAALVVDDDNLSFEAKARRSVLYLPLASSPREREALIAWALETQADTLGRVVGVRFTDLALSIEDESFAFLIGGVSELTGNALPDRACCKMPYQVWYAPFEPLSNRLVGRDERFTLDEPLLQRHWSRPGENAAFFGRFAR